MSDRPCVERFGPHDRHGLDCATVQEWNEASRTWREAPGIDCGFPGCTNTVNDGPLWRANPKGQPGFFVCGGHTPEEPSRWAQDMDRRIEQMREDPVAYVENARKAGVTA